VASSGDPLSGRFPFRRWLRPWPCIHLRGPRSRSGSGSRHDVRPPCLLPDPPPFGFFTPPVLPVRGIYFPALPSLPGVPGPACVAPVRPRPSSLASSRGSNPASFRLRRLFATLTVYSSPNPVTCFSHSHPWGSFSLLPARLLEKPVRAIPKNRASVRGGWSTQRKAPGRTWLRGLDFPARPKLCWSTVMSQDRRSFPSASSAPPPTPKCCRVASASLYRRSPLQSPKCLVRLRLPSTYASQVIRHRPVRRELQAAHNARDHRSVTKPTRFDPARPPRQQAAEARRARPRLRGCLSRRFPTAD
jgi:hypothetical protein